MKKSKPILAFFDGLDESPCKRLLRNDDENSIVHKINEPFDIIDNSMANGNVNEVLLEYIQTPRNYFRKTLDSEWFEGNDPKLTYFGLVYLFIGNSGESQIENIVNKYRNDENYRFFLKSH